MISTGSIGAATLSRDKAKNENDKISMNKF